MRVAIVPEATQSVPGQPNEVDPSLLAATDPIVNCVWGTRAPGVFTVTPVKLNGTEPVATVDADPMPASANVSAVKHKTVFPIVFKAFLRKSLGFLKMRPSRFLQQVPMVLVPIDAMQRCYPDMISSVNSHPYSSIRYGPPLRIQTHGCSGGLNNVKLFAVKKGILEWAWVDFSTPRIGET